MATEIYDRHGQLAPTIAVAELRRHPGKFWKLVDRRGAVGISEEGEALAVALSLDQFVSLLFGTQTQRRRMKRKPRNKARKKQ